MHNLATTPFRPRIVGVALALAFTATLSATASAAVSEQDAARLARTSPPSAPRRPPARTAPCPPGMAA